MEGRPRLESWKEISSYLQRSVKTCQRWEVELGLPIHRLDGTPSARVFADPDELDAWIAEKLHHAEAPEAGAAPPRSGQKYRWIFAAGATLALAAAGFLAWRWIPRVEPPPTTLNVPSLAILPFEDASSDGSLGLWTTALPQLLSLDFVQSRYASCTQLSDNLGLLKTLGLAEAKKFSADDLKRIAPAVGGEFLVTGSLVRSGKDIIVDVFLDDRKTAEPVHTFRSIARGEEELFASVDELTRAIKIKLSMPAKLVSQDVDDAVNRIATGSLEALAFYCQGIRFDSEGKGAEAVEAYQQALKIDPEFAEAYFRLFMVTSALTNCCDYDWAQKEAERAGSKAFEYSDRLNLWNRSNMASAFYLGFHRDIPRAMAEFKRLLGLMRDNAIIALQLAQIYWDLEDYPLLIGFLEKPVMKEDPRNVRLLANSYMRTGDLDRAEMTWAAFRQTHPRSSLYDQELLALARGRFDEAMAFNDHLRSGMQTPRYLVQYTRAPIFIAQDDFPGAEREIRAMIEKGSPSEQVEGRLYLARLLMTEGRLAEADAEAKSASLQAEGLEDNFIKSQSRLIRAAILRLSGDLNGALAEADEACRLSPLNGLFGLRPLHLKGLILLDMGRMEDFEKLAEEVKKSVEDAQFPKLMRAYYHLLGERETRLGRDDQAIDYFWKAMNLLPSPYGHDLDIDSSRYYFSLAESYERTGRFETALEMYRKVPFTWTQKLGAGDIYARCAYLIGRTYGQSLPAARWAKDREEAERAAALECLRKFLALRRDADPMFAAEVEDARARLAVLEAGPAASRPSHAK